MVETNSLNYKSSVNSNRTVVAEPRTIDEQVADLEKVIRKQNIEIMHLKEYIEAIDQRTKILVKAYNKEQGLLEKELVDNEKNLV